MNTDGNNVSNDQRLDTQEKSISISKQYRLNTTDENLKGQATSRYELSSNWSPCIPSIFMKTKYKESMDRLD